METQTKKFRRYLQKEGFKTTTVLSTIQLVPHFYKDRVGNHNLVNNISICIFGGSNIKPGDLGCVTFYYGGTQRLHRERRAYQAELFKKAFCPKTVAETIKTFENWQIETRQKIRNWTLIQ